MRIHTWQWWWGIVKLKRRNHLLFSLERYTGMSISRFYPILHKLRHRCSERYSEENVHLYERQSIVWRNAINIWQCKSLDIDLEYISVFGDLSVNNRPVSFNWPWELGRDFCCNIDLMAVDSLLGWRENKLSIKAASIGSYCKPFHLKQGNMATTNQGFREYVKIYY